jgi:hypothetical protein
MRSDLAGVVVRYPVQTRREAWVLPEGTVPESIPHDAGRELVVFDPFLAGPSALGGPVPLQLWRRDRVGMLERVHADDTPAPSEVLGAWLIPTTTTLEIADDREGARRWMTWEELAAAKETEIERERTEKERERAARLELERRIAEIEAKVSLRFGAQRT